MFIFAKATDLCRRGKRHLYCPLCMSQSSGLNAVMVWRVTGAPSPKQAIFGTGSKEGKDLHSYRKKTKETKF